MNNWQLKIHPNVKCRIKFIHWNINIWNFERNIQERLTKFLNIAKSQKNKGINLHEPLKREHLFKKLNKAEFFCPKGTHDETFCMAVKLKHLLYLGGLVIMER